MFTAKDARELSHKEYIIRETKALEKAKEWCETVVAEQIKEECISEVHTTLHIPSEIRATMVASYLKENGYVVPEVITSHTFDIFW